MNYRLNRVRKEMWRLSWNYFTKRSFFAGKAKIGKRRWQVTKFSCGCKIKFSFHFSGKRKIFPRETGAASKNQQSVL